MGKNHDGDGPALDSWAKGVYTGHAGQTRIESLHYSCPCSAVFPARVYRVVNASRDPEPAERLRSGTLNQVTCPSCGHVAEAQVSVIYHDEDERRFALMLPESGRTRELWERAELLRLVAEDADTPVPDYVKQAEVVFGLDGLLIWLENEGRLITATTSLEQIAREQALEERGRDLDEREAAVAGREGALAQQKREVADARAEQGRQRHDLEARADELAKRERSLLRREETATRRDAELNDHESRLRERETRLTAREGELDALQERMLQRVADEEHTGKVPRTTPPPPPPPRSKRKPVEERARARARARGRRRGGAADAGAAAAPRAAASAPHDPGHADRGARRPGGAERAGGGADAAAAAGARARRRAGAERRHAAGAADAAAARRRSRSCRASARRGRTVRFAGRHPPPARARSAPSRSWCVGGSRAGSGPSPAWCRASPTSRRRCRRGRPPPSLAPRSCRFWSSSTGCRPTRCWRSSCWPVRRRTGSASRWASRSTS